MTFPKHLFNTGTFYLDVLIVENRSKPIIWEKDLLSFVVNSEAKEMGSWMGKEAGYFRGEFNWTKK